MAKTNNVFILLLCLLWAKTTIADQQYYPGGQYFQINKSLGITDSGAFSDKWLNLGPLNVNKVQEITYPTDICAPRNFLCTGASVRLGYNGQANYILDVKRYVATITDDAGNNYMLTLAFPDNPLVAGIYERNSAGGRTWYTIADINNKFTSLPDSTQDTANASATAQGYCGAVGGCEYSIGTYIHTNSGMPYLYVKLPKTMSAKEISFTNLNLLEFMIAVRRKDGHTVTPSTAKLYVSGSISVPQRCYIKADKNSFDFGTIYSNANNGVVKDGATSITTDCYYAPQGTVQSLKVEVVSGGVLNDRQNVYQVASDPALGIVFNINENSMCEPTTYGRNIFNQAYLLRKTFTEQQHNTWTDTINFSLCKYGVPSVTGQKKVMLKLTSRWVVD
ncbi:hypothetical protein ACH32H_18135 [Escherichia coli]|uniref:hypothetical protein n=1 Tax=Escherichia coli TaxID=562 RepID=UPI0037B374BE